MQIDSNCISYTVNLTVEYHLFHKWHMKKYGCIYDTLFFNRNTAVSVFEELLFVISSLSIVCMRSESLYFGFIPLVLTLPLSVLPSFPLHKEGLLWRSAPRSLGIQCCRVQRLCRAHWPPWELNTINTSKAGPCILWEQDWFVAIKFCFTLHERWFKMPFLCLRVILSEASHFTSLSVAPNPCPEVTSLLCAISPPAGNSRFALPSDAELDRRQFCHLNWIICHRELKK